VVTLSFKNEKLVLGNPSCVKSPCFFLFFSLSYFFSCSWTWFSERTNGAPACVWSIRRATCWCLLWLGFIFYHFVCVFWLAFGRHHTTPRLGS
jgi:hypothetical protein